MKEVEFCFNGHCLESFQQLKEALNYSPIMQPPNWSIPFEIMCNAIDYVVGIILRQKRDKKMHPIYYTIRTLDEARINYAITEKELLVVVFVFDKLCSYLVGSNIIVYSSHVDIKYLMSMKDAKPRLISWIFFCFKSFI